MPLKQRAWRLARSQIVPSVMSFFPFASREMLSYQGREFLVRRKLSFTHARVNDEFLDCAVITHSSPPSELPFGHLHLRLLWRHSPLHLYEHARLISPILMYRD